LVFVLDCSHHTCDILGKPHSPYPSFLFSCKRLCNLDLPISIELLKVSSIAIEHIIWNTAVSIKTKVFIAIGIGVFDF
jgi:hypothetical protein